MCLLCIYIHICACVCVLRERETVFSISFHLYSSGLFFLAMVSVEGVCRINSIFPCIPLPFLSISQPFFHLCWKTTVVIHFVKWNTSTFNANEKLLYTKKTQGNDLAITIAKPRMHCKSCVIVFIATNDWQACNRKLWRQSNYNWA